MIDADGKIRLLEAVRLSGPRRALVMVLDERPSSPGETALLAESSLAADWARPEEDAAWAHLQRMK